MVVSRRGKQNRAHAWSRDALAQCRTDRFEPDLQFPVSSPPPHSNPGRTASEVRRRPRTGSSNPVRRRRSRRCSRRCRQRRRASSLGVEAITNCVCVCTRTHAVMCSAGHVVSSEPIAFFPRFVEAAQVNDVRAGRVLWSSTCLTSFQTLDRNEAAGKEEDI